MREELWNEITSLTMKVENGKKKLAEFEKQIAKIQERIVLGKIEESLGDQMLSDIYIEREVSTPHRRSQERPLESPNQEIMLPLACWFSLQLSPTSSTNLISILTKNLTGSMNPHCLIFNF